MWRSNDQTQIFDRVEKLFFVLMDLIDILSSPRSNYCCDRRVIFGGDDFLGIAEVKPQKAQKISFDLIDNGGNGAIFV